MRRGRRLHRRRVLPRQARLHTGTNEGAIGTGGPMIINLLATWIPALGIAFLGALKLTGNPRVAEEMSKLGFILASCYFAGAIATELSHDVLKVSPFVPIVLLWIGAFIRDRSIFF